MTCGSMFEDLFTLSENECEKNKETILAGSFRVSLVIDSEGGGSSIVFGKYALALL